MRTRIWTAALAAVLFIVAAAPPLSSRAQRPQGTQSKDEGTLRFDLTPCATLTKNNVSQVNIDAWFAPTSNPKKLALDRKLVWNPVKEKHLALELPLPAGFYHFAVVATAGRITCDYQRFAAVLPGKTQTITDDMDDGVANPIAALLFAGTLPEGATGWLVRYDGTPDCGQPVEPLVRHDLLQVEVQDGAFYAYDIPHAPRPFPTTDVAFGLEVGWPDDRRRVILLHASYPKSLNGEAAGLRFDVTPAVAQYALAQPADVLVCPAKG